MKQIHVGVVGADQQLQWSAVYKSEQPLLPLNYANNIKAAQKRSAIGLGILYFGIDELRLTFSGDNVAVLYRKYLTREQCKAEGRNARYSKAKGHYILRVQDKGKNMQESRVSVGSEYSVRSLDMQFQPDGALQCIGSCSRHVDQESLGFALAPSSSTPAHPVREDYSAHLGGVFRLRLLPDGQIQDVQLSPLKPLLMKHIAYLDKHSEHRYNTEVEHGKDADYNKVEAAGYLYYPDGSAVLLYEVRTYYMKSRSLDSEDIWSDIIVVRMAPDGKAVWANAIPKLQEETNRKAGLTSVSFGVVREDEDLHFFYVDAQKQDAALQWVSLDGQGSMHIHKPLEFSASGVIPAPNAAAPIGPRTLMIPGEYNNTARMGLLKF